MMKSILKILITIFLAGTIAACDYLDVVPDNVAVIENAFSDKYNAEKFLATCYSYIPNFGDPWINPGLLSGDEVGTELSRSLPQFLGWRTARKEHVCGHPRLQHLPGRDQTGG